MAGEDISLIFTSAITDLSGNPLVPYTEEFHTAPTLKKDFVTQGTIAAVADLGPRTIVIERLGADDGRLAIFRQGTDLLPAAESGSLSLPPFPRALAVIENFSFKRHPGMPTETKSLAVVTGGLLGSEEIGSWLWVIDISDPANPTRVAASLANVDFAAAITKLKIDRGVIWAAVNTPEGPFIQAINLQAFILGSYLKFNLAAGIDEFAPTGGELPGEDLNQDGDYVDLGEKLPKPSRNQVFGLYLTVPLAPGTFLNDFDFDSETGTLCAVLRHVSSGTQSKYQTVLLGGEIIGIGGPNDPGGVPFSAVNGIGGGENPLRVIIDRDVRVATPTGPKTVPLAAIVTSGNAVLIFDIVTTPLSPQLVESVQFPPGTTTILHLSRREETTSRRLLRPAM